MKIIKHVTFVVTHRAVIWSIIDFRMRLDMASKLMAMTDLYSTVFAEHQPPLTTTCRAERCAMLRVACQ
jgi:hypothetical protein